MKKVIVATIYPLALILGGCGTESKSKTEVIDVRMPDGTTIKNVPKGTSQATLQSKIERNGYDTASMTRPGQPSQNLPLSFHGYPCRDDCSGHSAGYQWAEDRGIDDPNDCGGNSLSFEEGCRAYAEENGY